VRERLLANAFMSRSLLGHFPCTELPTTVEAKPAMAVINLRENIFLRLRPRNYRALQQIVRYMNNKRKKKKIKTTKVGSSLGHRPMFKKKATRLLEIPLRCKARNN
jgi:hypothetical protein